MSVYVDAPIHRFRGMIMCHMMADTPEELHEMADKIGVARRHAQHKTLLHYDICKSKRSLAVGHGAIEIGRRQLANWMRQYREGTGV